MRLTKRGTGRLLVVSLPALAVPAQPNADSAVIAESAIAIPLPRRHVVATCIFKACKLTLPQPVMDVRHAGKARRALWGARPSGREI